MSSSRSNKITRSTLNKHAYEQQNYSTINLIIFESVSKLTSSIGSASLYQKKTIVGIILSDVY